MYHIALLLTVHNRKDLTLKCLESIYQGIQLCASDTYSFNVYMVDAASVDGTSEEVSKRYPSVNIISGNGELYWCRGMFVAWTTAISYKKYDFYILINDDIILKIDSMKKILFASECFDNQAILSGAFCSKLNGKLTYGGALKDGKSFAPNGSYRKIIIFCANFLLVPKAVVDKIGIIDNVFHHAVGDYDYALRAYEFGIQSYLMPEYVGTCEAHSNIDKCYDPTYSLRERFAFLYSPLYHPLDTFILLKRHYSCFRAIGVWLKIHLLVLFPSLKI